MPGEIVGVNDIHSSPVLIQLTSLIKLQLYIPQCTQCAYSLL